MTSSSRRGLLLTSRVVVTGQLLVRPGGKVRVEGSPSAAPAANANSKTNKAPGAQS